MYAAKDLHSYALYEALPLIIYPIVFFVETAVAFIIDQRVLLPGMTPSESLVIISGVLYPSWSCSAGVLLMMHVCIVKCYVMRQRSTRDVAGTGTGFWKTIQVTDPDSNVRSTTYYSPPVDD